MGLSLDQINAFGHRLLHEPELYIPMRDALEDLGLRWSEWLERSGALTGLAESMHFGGPGRSIALHKWLDDIDAHQCLQKPGFYTSACAAYRCPAMLIETGREFERRGAMIAVSRYLGFYEPEMLWNSPSPALAEETLRVALQYEAKVGMTMKAAWGYAESEPWRQFVLEPLEASVRQHQPEATALRIRLGHHALWTIKQFARP